MKRFYIKIAIVAMLPVFIGCKEKALEGKQFDTFIKFFGTSDLEIGYDLKTTADGGYILAGTQTTATGSDIYVVKTDRFGNQEWTRNIGGSASESASAIAIDTDGNYVVAGYVEDASGNRDVFLAKFDAAGVLWQSTFGGAENEEGANRKDNYVKGGMDKSAKKGWKREKEQKGPAHNKTVYRNKGGNPNFFYAFF